ncbi:uncharacterized protein F4812DRAFT_463287 [Daldinia caldariorum]|uniref:uncharacterized protein n=1 Tax=Daldinia caldariorum TaxID=326644 RepID=UPI0020077076|nr:uncharacterized protein F4812DRAFT_463287 [Daldinia caldariorum]KAI1463955.1 hypothetical protein F4812DRAFT_463287 [Daldinia caldariorum]
MSARLRSNIFPTPVKTNSSVPRKSLKHRLFLDEEEDEDEDEDTRPPSPKKHRKTHYSVAPLFDRYRRPRSEENDKTPSHIHNRRQRLSPSPDPDPPLALELGERYANLRATIHSAAIAGLEEAEAELIAQSEAKIHANRQQMAALETQLNKLISPLQDLTVDYTATGEDGCERTAAAEVQVEIDDLGEETLSRKGSDRAAGEIRLVGASIVSGISPSASASHAEAHAEALAGFGTDLDRASKDVVEEMMTYEEEFLKKIEKEAGNILHSFLNS